MALAVLLMAATAFAQDKLLQWDQLMDRNLYPQREAMSFVFAPDGKTVTYYKGGEVYGFDGKKEFKLTEAQQDWRKPQNHDPKLEGRVEKKDGNLLVDGKLVERGDGYNVVLARACIATSSASTVASSGRPSSRGWPSTAWTRAWWWTTRW